MSVTLACVVYGKVYEDYAAEMWESARKHFKPSTAVELLEIPGEPGWPHASGVRYKLLTQTPIHTTHVFLLDADALFVGDVGPEILADGLVVTTHPGFPLSVDGHHLLPFDRTPHSRAFVSVEDGKRYYPGAFVGGETNRFLEMARWIAKNLEADEKDGHSPEWYDEAYVNRFLIDNPPALVLPREYCWWDQQWGPDPAGQGAKIMHRDKTEAEFDWRDNQDATELVA